MNVACGIAVLVAMSALALGVWIEYETLHGEISELREELERRSR
jgi:hypothetical protein